VRVKNKRNVLAARNGEIGFGVWRNAVSVMSAGHTHTDIEINRVARGRVTYFTSRGFEELGTGDCAIFWAGMPHELVRASPDSEMTWAVFPLTWLVQWNLPPHFFDRLLQGHWLRPSSGNTALEDALFARWVEDQKGERGEDTTRILALEIEAWLRRVARAVPDGAVRGGAQPVVAASQTVDASARHVETLARIVAQRYREEISVADIAAEAQLHPHYAMEIWKRGCGLTLWEYLLRLRLSHAQRLLLATDWTMERIAEESGFGSRARFYAAFKKQTGTSPRRWKTRN
jgi:AraC-like DNA-binding protein